MTWIFTSLVHTLIILAFLFLAWLSGNIIIAALFIFGGFLFFVRSINHPDYFFRRAMVACLNAGLAHITIFNLASDFLSHVSSEKARAILSAIIAILEPAPWIGPALIFLSVVFGTLELVRLKIMNPGSQKKSKPYIQIQEEPKEEHNSKNKTTVISIIVIGRNPTNAAIDLTSPQIVRNGLWPRRTDAKMEVYYGQKMDNSGPKTTHTIPAAVDGNNKPLKLILTAEFKWRKYWDWCVESSTEISVFKAIFGERRAVLRTTMPDGRRIAILDVWPKSKL